MFSYMEAYMKKHILVFVMLISSVGSIFANNLTNDPILDQLVEQYVAENKECYESQHDQFMNVLKNLSLLFPEYSLTQENIEQFKKYGPFYIEFVGKFAQSKPELLASAHFKPEMPANPEPELLEAVFQDFECDQIMSFDQFKTIFMITQLEQSDLIKFHIELFAYIKEELTKQFSN